MILIYRVWLRVSCFVIGHEVTFYPVTTMLVCRRCAHVEFLNK